MWQWVPEAASNIILNSSKPPWISLRHIETIPLVLRLIKSFVSIQQSCFPKVAFNHKDHNLDVNSNFLALTLIVTPTWENKRPSEWFYCFVQSRHHAWLPVPMHFFWKRDFNLNDTFTWLNKRDIQYIFILLFHSSGQRGFDSTPQRAPHVMPSQLFPVIFSSGSLRLSVVSSHWFVIVVNWPDWREDTQTIPKVQNLYIRQSQLVDSGPWGLESDTPHLTWFHCIIRIIFWNLSLQGGWIKNYAVKWK